MDAVPVAVAKAVTARIDAATLSQKFTVERSYADWDLQLQETDLLILRDAEKLRVDVVAHPTQQKTQLSARGKVQYIVPVDIAIRRKFGTDKQNNDTGRVQIEELDALVLLVQELHLLFTPVRLVADGFIYPVWDGENGGTDILMNPQPSHLRQNRQFTGLVRVFFRADVNVSSGS